MAIGSISLQGQISRAQDFSTIKQNEDNKVIVDQGNFQTQFKKEIDQNMNRVRQSDNTENQGKKYDAKEKGGGQYSGDGGKRRKHDEQTDSVQLKGQKPHGFDIKI